MTEFEVLRVFCGPDGSHGNALGVVRDGAAVPERADRQRIARELGFSETVFVDDPERGEIDIYAPSVRLPFAGHPCVGAAWLLGVDRLVTAAGEVAVRRADGLVRIAARPEWAPARTLRQYGSAAEVEALEVPPPGEWVYAWAWRDDAAGTVRARAFPGRGDGIDEDEATGAAALLLAARLGRELAVTQGRGSLLLAGPRGGGLVEVGGRVVRAPGTAQPAGGVGSA
ncbi:PhzF family phenazine biosynthesis protein [Kitasatospora sp. NPDC002543]